ncbi:hypothetical protein GGC64_002133 [Mycobacterium sp. OAS707]|nr:hypothetical protein [Mycobacterium sp. OAS707]
MGQLAGRALVPLKQCIRRPEVLAAIAVEHGAALATIVDIARVKRDERGGFDLRLWLDGVDPQP